MEMQNGEERKKLMGERKALGGSALGEEDST